VAAIISIMNESSVCLFGSLNLIENVAVSLKQSIFRPKFKVLCFEVLYPAVLISHAPSEHNASVFKARSAPSAVTGFRQLDTKGAITLTEGFK
jgi:hypothetical protein